MSLNEGRVYVNLDMPPFLNVYHQAIKSDDIVSVEFMQTTNHLTGENDQDVGEKQVTVVYGLVTTLSKHPYRDLDLRQNSQLL